VHTSCISPCPVSATDSRDTILHVVYLNFNMAGRARRNSRIYRRGRCNDPRGVK
jgi:hypothetical protein